MTRTNHFWPLIILFFLSWFLLPGQPTVAQNEAAAELTMSARAGFDGYYRQQNWVPVQVTVANTGPAIEGELRTTIGSFNAGDQVVYTAPISLPTQSNKRVTLFVDIRVFLRDLVVELRDENGRVVAEAQANSLNQIVDDSVLYGIVSSEAGELEFLEKVTGSRRTAAAAFLAIHELPEAPVAWNNLDVLVFNDVDTGQLTAGQQESLRQWVATGGQLVVTGGAGWQKSTAVFGDMLPVTVNGSETVTELPLFTDAIGIPFRDPGPYVVATSSLRSGDLLYHEAGLPLLARQSWGRGQVYFLALDPRLAPLKDWDGSEKLWATIANDLPANPYWWRGVQNSYAAQSAVTSLPSLTLPSVVGLVGFLVLYVVAIGPVNYIYLKRKGRRELAWVTIPILVLLFSAIAYFTGFQLKGNEVILNQMTVVYGRVGGEPTRAQSLLGLYSPGRSTYNLVLPADVMARPFEQNFGNIGGSGNIAGISRGADLVIESIRVDVSGIETFVLDSYQDGISVTAQASLSQQGNDIIINARVQNDSDTALQNAAILFGSQAFPLGTLAPGAEATLEQKMGQAQSSLASAPSFTGMVPLPVGSAPLTGNAATILGTSNYYDDRDVYPRWQLLEALDSTSFGSMMPPSMPANAVTLVAWTSEGQISAHLENVSFQEMATTLYLLEVPLQQTLIRGENVSLPLPLLQWSVLDQVNLYDVNVQNLYMNNSSRVDFAYLPWREMQELEVSRLDIVLESQQTTPTMQPPKLFLWDWEQEQWEAQEIGWGITEVVDYGRFLGANNEVRLRLRADQFGLEIRQVYPRLTGNLQ